MVSKDKRNGKDEEEKGRSIVSDKNYIESCNIVIRYLEIIKDRSQFICDSKGDINKII